MEPKHAHPRRQYRLPHPPHPLFTPDDGAAPQRRRCGLSLGPALQPRAKRQFLPQRRQQAAIAVFSLSTARHSQKSFLARICAQADVAIFAF